MRQKFAIQFEALKIQVNQGKVRSAGELERSLDK
jgi:hypothetical protein